MSNKSKEFYNVYNKTNPMSYYDYLIVLYEYRKNIDKGNLSSAPWHRKQKNFLSPNKFQRCGVLKNPFQRYGY